MEDLISVIVPVYNSEKYIDNCAESVLMQTYSAFELILIEDGSKDNSLKRCEAFCKKDKRIRLIRQNHKGASAARNLGIEVAEGKYLFFLDSDDMIHPHLLESLYRLQEEKHTVMAAGGICYSENGLFFKTAAGENGIERTPESFYLDNKIALKYVNKPVLCGIGGKLILRKAINSVRFNENLSHGEDTLFIYQLLVNGADLSVLCCDWYYYRRHEDNASREFSPEACQDRYRVERHICNHEMQSKRRENAIYIEWNIVVMITNWYVTGRISKDMELLKYTKELAEREMKLKIFHQLNWRMKLYFYLIIYCYPLSTVILKVSKKLRISLKCIEGWI